MLVHRIVGGEPFFSIWLQTGPRCADRERFPGAQALREVQDGYRHVAGMRISLFPGKLCLLLFPAKNAVRYTTVVAMMARDTSPFATHLSTIRFLLHTKHCQDEIKRKHRLA